MCIRDSLCTDTGPEEKKYKREEIYRRDGREGFILFSKVLSAGIGGVDAYPVRVEADVDVYKRQHQTL